MAENLSATEVAEIKRAFSVFDVDGDGAITSKELADVMRSFGLNPKEEDLNDMINKFDIDGDGMVSFPEFLNMMVQDTGTSMTKDIARTIHLFDNYHNGYMDLTEMENILLTFGGDGGAPKPEEADLIREMISELKVHTDGPSGMDNLLRTELALSLLISEEEMAEYRAEFGLETVSTSLPQTSPVTNDQDVTFDSLPADNDTTFNTAFEETVPLVGKAENSNASSNGNRLTVSSNNKLGRKASSRSPRDDRYYVQMFHSKIK